MATTKVNLTATAWTDLGACPLSVIVNDGRVHLVIDTAAPSTTNIDTIPSILIGSGTDEDGADCAFTGQRVYARSGAGATASVVVVK